MKRQAGWCGLLLWAAFSFARPVTGEGFPTPQAAGFHHCALIYERPQREPGDLAPYVSRHMGSRPREWLFDAFLFLTMSSGRGVRTDYGETRREDWQYQLDRWFAPGRDLRALDAAIKTAAQSLGSPPAPRTVILSIPFPNPAVRDFGDVDGDGRSEDLSTSPGREAVFRWYLGEARRRFRAARFRHLRLWGFYWMREDIAPEDEPKVRQAAAQVHTAGERLLWIPWFRAQGWDAWRRCGIDVALMQPNYAFVSWIHKGRVRRNRLAVTADLARTHGLGVEMEAGDVLSSAADRRAFLHYLAEGARSRLGYQRTATAYYLGTDTVERAAGSRDAAARQVYAALSDYITGRAVPDPDARLRWTLNSDVPASSSQVLQARLDRPVRLSALDVFLNEPDPKRAWSGVVEIEARRPGEKVWQPAGWTVRSGADSDAGRHQVMTVPMDITAAALRIVLHPRPGAPPPRITRLAPDTTGLQGVRKHLALRCAYRADPPPPASYGDSGRELTDSVVPDTGFPSGQTVGWFGGEAAIGFDLGRVVSVSTVEVHAQGGSYAGVNWPTRAVAFLSTQGPTPSTFSGPGRLPGGFAWVSAGPVKVDRRRSGTDMDGHLTFTLPRPTSARWVTLLLEGGYWLMLSEVRIVSEGRNIAPEAHYALSPPPTPPEDEAARYTDDGRRLTDGIVAREFVPTMLTGWLEDRPRVFTVDLGAVRPVRTVTVDSLRGGLHAIHAPAEVGVEVSTDGRGWREGGKARAPGTPEDGRACLPTQYRVLLPKNTSARFVRVHVTRRAGWAMLSEIEVE